MKSALAATAVRYLALKAAVRLSLVAAMLASPLLSLAAAVHTLKGHVPAAAKYLAPVGRVDPGKRLNLAIGLPLRNPQGLTNLLGQIYDSRSPRYQQYLTPSQFAESFSPTEEEYSSAIAFAQSQGFAITQMHGNRLVLDVSASVGEIERAFHIKLQQYQDPNQARFFFAPDTEPSVEASVPILDISGLSDFGPPRPLVHKLPLPKGAQLAAQPAAGSGPGGTYRGTDFRAAYAPNVASSGLGQTLALLEFDGYYANDISSYVDTVGLPSVTLTNVLLDGFDGTPGNANMEVALDIEVAIAMAPGLSQIIVYQAGPGGSPNDILSRMASDNLARQISSSWTWSGGPNATTGNLLSQLAAQGQSYFQASGDDGAYTSAIPQPADSPYATVVGGTTLSTSGPGGSWSSEKAWNWYITGNGTNGTSGGVSTTVAIPSWQQPVSMANNQGSTTMRNIPDVAMTGDNVWIIYNNGTSGAVGGTSCSAPLWAAFTALINQQAVANGHPPVGFLNPSLYSIATGTNYSSAFHDITTGNNTNKTSPTKFFAVSGFDLCTGFGTPTGSPLINALAGPPMPRIVSNSLAIVTETCINNAVDPGETVTVNFGLINVGSANTANLVATLQSGSGVNSPSGPQTYGPLATGGSEIARPFTFTAAGTCGGVVTATLKLQDGATDLGTVSFAIRLGAVTPITAFSENVDSVTAPALPPQWTSTVTSGTQSKWISTNGFSDTSPNSFFAHDIGTASQTELVSPVFSVASSAAQLTFRHNYDLASHITGHPTSTNYYDGGVLQISIGNNPFSDIVAAGGSFVTGGYSCTLSTGTGNPLAGAPAWGASSSGWTTTVVSLPATAAGQNVQLKWVCGTGVNSTVAVGWFVDSISVQDSTFSCCSPGADVEVMQTEAPNPAALGRNLVYTLTVSNAGPSSASGITLTDSLPGGVTFVSVSPGCTNSSGSVSCTIGTLAVGSSSNILITIQPGAVGTLTNSVTVNSTTSDPNSSNNSSVNSINVYAPPGVATQPSNQVVKVGGSAAFSVTATGSSPLTYQWTFGGTPLSGATAATLTLANVQPNQAGNYAAVITNSVGSVTSAVATLTVQAPPSIAAQPTNQTVVVGGNAAFQVSAAGTTPLNYQWMFNGAPITGATASALALNNVKTNQAGGYGVIVTNAVGSITSVLANLTVLVPPSITLAPTNQTVMTGSNVVFQGGASGSAPLSYQWLLGGTALAGATTTSLSLTNVQSNQAGNYTFVVTNTAGAATSSIATLTVLVAPAITSQPTNQSVNLGDNTSFQVTATGSAPLSYQWWFNGTNAVGANTNTLSLTNVQTSQAGPYLVIVTNAAGVVTSSVATLTISAPPAITQQPSSQTVVQGQNATFTVAATGAAPLTYQWRFKGLSISGATTNSYTVVSATAANAGAYDVVVGNANGYLISAAAQLTVLVPPAISSQPSNQTVSAGGNASFQVSATGSSPMGYQWWFNSTNAVGANTNTLVLTNVQTSQAGSYNVVVTNLAGAATSAVAVLTIGTPPGLAQQPSSLSVIKGQDANFNVIARGDAPLSYQWRMNGKPVNGGNSSNYTVSATTETSAGAYDVIVNNPYGSVTSVVAQLTVLVPPAITVQPTSQAVTAGATVNFLVSASGSSPLSYQWWFNGTNALSANTNVLSLTNVQPSQAGAYAVVVANPAGSITSSVVTLAIGTSPAITQQPSSLSVIKGQDANFNVIASGDAPLSYQWRMNGSPVNGGNSSNYTLSAATETSAGAYDVVVNNPYGSVTSVVAQLTVLVAPAITTQPTSQTVTAGATVNFMVSASGSSPLSYQWWFNGTNALSGNSNVLSLTNVQPSQAGAYAVVIANAAGSITSVVATLTIGMPPSISQQPSNLAVIQGQNAGFAIIASGDAPLNYQWRFNGTPTAGATDSAYVVIGATLANAGAYDVVVNNTYGTTTSAAAQLTVFIPLAITAQLTNQTVIAGSTVNFEFGVSGSSPLGFQWWFNGTNLLVPNTNVLTLTNIQASLAGDYMVVATNAVGAVTSIVAQLTVLSPLSITMQPTNQTALVGGSTSFSVSATGTAPLSYQWAFNGTNIAGATATTLSLTNIQAGQAGTYAVLVTNLAGSVSSDLAYLKVLVPTSIADPVITGTNVSVQVSTQAGLIYLLEYKNNLQDPDWNAASSWTAGTGGTVTLSDTNAPPGSRFYRVRLQ